MAVGAVPSWRSRQLTWYVRRPNTLLVSDSAYRVQSMEWFLRVLPDRPQPIWIRYAATTILVAVCFLIMKGVQFYTPVQGYFLLFPAIFMAAVAFDRGSGFYAIALSTVLLAFWGPDFRVEQFRAEHWIGLSLFVIIGFALAAVSEGLRVGWERALKAEKQTALLLRELQHRTKNEFAMAAAMLRLQVKAQPNNELRAALASAIGRIETLGRGHQDFELLDSGLDIPLRPYLEGLCGRLRDWASATGPITIKVAAEDIALPAKHANTVGLIANELVTNCCKHAFDSDIHGNVIVSFTRSASSLALVIQDDGKGCPEGTKDE
jgi:two-component sensor histidine kinase